MVGQQGGQEGSGHRGTGQGVDRAGEGGTRRPRRLTRELTGGRRGRGSPGLCERLREGLRVLFGLVTGQDGVHAELQQRLVA